MMTQKEQGHWVGLLWPGRMGLINHKLKIFKTEGWNEIASFEIVNPLPVALDEGILDIPVYTRKTNPAPYRDFLKKCDPDVIHVHTLMGLHQEFLDMAKEQGVPVVFTSHDYFGLCPRAVLFHDGKPCDDDHNCIDCVRCNQCALSLKKIILLQSPLYRTFKNNVFVKKLRRRHRSRFFELKTAAGGAEKRKKAMAQDYRELRSYYISMLKKMDVLHFNSSLTKEIYGRYFKATSSRILPITHRDIQDHRRIKTFNHERLRLTYLGPAKPLKGFYYLLSTLDELWKRGIRNFELHLYEMTTERRSYITHQQEGYPYSQLEEIFADTDLLVVPSLWYETFGFTVLEALCYGVPVLVSKTVGAGALLEGGRYGCAVTGGTRELYDQLSFLCRDRSGLAKYNRVCVEQFALLSMGQHSREILSLYGGKTGEAKGE